MIIMMIIFLTYEKKFLGGFRDQLELLDVKESRRIKAGRDADHKHLHATQRKLNRNSIAGNIIHYKKSGN